MSVPTSLELFYFPIRGRGDLPRSLMLDGGLAFTETRIPKGEQWLARKPEFVFGQMPVLRVNGSLDIAQSHAIARYVAKLTNPGLLGDTIDEQANVDMWYYQTDDVYVSVIRPFYRDYSTVGQLFADNWATWAAPFEKALSGADYLANGKLSLADFHLFDVSEVVGNFRPELLDQTPRVKAHRERLAGRPGIAKFRDYVKDLPFTNSGHF